MKITTEIKPGYKKTNLGYIPKEWEIKPCDELGTIYTGGTPKTEIEEYWNGTINWFTPTDISSKYVSSSKRKITEKGQKNSSAKLLPISTIIVCTRATIGELSICQEISTTNQGFKNIHCNKSIETEYLYYQLLFSKNRLVKLSCGSTFLELSTSEFRKFEILTPPLPEQKKIADILSTWDRSIDTTETLIEQLQLRKKGLMHQLLSGKKRLPGFIEEWETVSLGELININLRPISKPNVHYLALGLRSHGKGIFHKPDFNPSSISMDTLYQVATNDLVVNITFAWEHAIAVANEKDSGGLVSHRFPTYTFKKGISHFLFFRYYILQPRFKYLLGLISPGGAGRNRVMSKKDFLKLKVIVPAYAEQKAIATILDKTDEEILQFTKYLDEIKEQKKGLMQQLLTGQKRVAV